MQMDGIYAAFLTGKGGNNFALLLFKNGVVTGADMVGGLFDGNYTVNDDATVSLKLQVTIPAGFPMITGQPAENVVRVNPIETTLPSDFLAQKFIRVEGSTGPVNVTIKKLRELGRDE